MTAVPSTGATLSALVRLSIRRVLRRKALRVSLAIAALPTVFASLMHRRSVVSAADDTFDVVLLLVAILPALFVAASLGEEIEDRTATYLWSRPLARWTVIVGKLIALAPIAIAIVCASWLVALAASLGIDHVIAPYRATGGLAAGTLAVCCASAGIAALVPRHGMALTIVYVLFDMMIGALPSSIASLSITHHATVLGSFKSDAHALAESGITLAVISAVWLALGLARIRKLEA